MPRGASMDHHGRRGQLFTTSDIVCHCIFHYVRRTPLPFRPRPREAPRSTLRRTQASPAWCTQCTVVHPWARTSHRSHAALQSSFHSRSALSCPCAQMHPRGSRATRAADAVIALIASYTLHRRTLTTDRSFHRNTRTGSPVALRSSTGPWLRAGTPFH
jgi:hypothetical protein